MCQQQYDITYEDLNPVFLYTTHGIRRSSEQPHSHDFPEIAVILDGTGEFCVDGSTLPVKKGELLLFNPAANLHLLPGNLLQGHPGIRACSRAHVFHYSLSGSSVFENKLAMKRTNG